MNWKPIAHYDALKIKPKNCIFYFEEEQSRIPLRPILQLTRFFGSRVCTKYMEFKMPEET